jgi:glycosyltransferase involved in cell wall biosynthesis
MTEPLISICIPTYNQTTYLRQTISSILSQQEVVFEIIISDDSSTNDVKTMLDEFIEHHTNIKYVRNSPALGSPKNWDNAISLAQGEYIKIMHHDEWFIDDFALSKFLKATENLTTKLVVSASELIYFGVKKQFFLDNKSLNKIVQQPESLLLANRFGSPSAIFFHKSCIQKFDSTLIWLVDIEYYIRMLLDKKVSLVYIEQALYCSVMDAHNITNSCIHDTELQLKEYSYLFKKYIHFLPWYTQFRYLKKIYIIISISQRTKKYILILRLIKKSFF